MAELLKRFGTLVSARRRRLTLAALARLADLSPDMIGKIGKGRSGARFGVIERLARALEVEAAELFTADLPKGALRRGVYGEVACRLAGLSDPELHRILHVLDACMGRGAREEARQ